jgi:glycosyltransferase involved in cell wall biosynthesis
MVARTAAPPSQSDRPGRSALRVAFVMEQTLGHVAYSQNLQGAFARDETILPTWLSVDYQRGGLLRRVPALGTNWTLRGSAIGGLDLLRLRRRQRFDAALFHTQTVALLSPIAGWGLPVVISLDATPLNFDAVGHHYGHALNAGRVEAAKRRAHSLVYRRAAALTTWSEWAKGSLRDDYGVDPDRVTVIPPGVNLDFFATERTAAAATDHDRVRVLFVGGDFARKGGPDLLACMRGGLAERCELHVVTRQPVPATPGVVVHTDIGPNDPRLLALYRQADIFALPTHADCLAVVLGEALAAGLPVVTTRVGAQAEAVRDGGSGLLVRDGDQQALGAAIARLASDPALRLRMGREGRRTAEARFDARKNAGRLARAIADGVDRWRERSGQMQAAAAHR